jgi:hypothetical protein
MRPVEIAITVWETGVPCEDLPMVFFALILVGLMEAATTAGQVPADEAPPEDAKPAGR